MTEPTTAHRVTWFAPDRPVEGNTIFVQPTPEAPMTDPDLAAAARIVAALADAIDAHDNWIPADHANVRAAADDLADGDPDDKSIAAALLDAARRELAPAPRAWLPGDTVPADVWAIDDEGYIVEYREHVTRAPLVEVPVPDFTAAVAAEQARRAATGGEVAE